MADAAGFHDDADLSGTGGGLLPPDDLERSIRADHGYAFHGATIAGPRGDWKEALAAGTTSPDSRWSDDPCRCQIGDAADAGAQNRTPDQVDHHHAGRESLESREIGQVVGGVGNESEERAEE